MAAAGVNERSIACRATIVAVVAPVAVPAACRTTPRCRPCAALVEPGSIRSSTHGVSAATSSTAQPASSAVSPPPLRDECASAEPAIANAAAIVNFASTIAPSHSRQPARPACGRPPDHRHERDREEAHGDVDRRLAQHELDPHDERERRHQRRGEEHHEAGQRAAGERGRLQQLGRVARRRVRRRDRSEASACAVIQSVSASAELDERDGREREQHRQRECDERGVREHAQVLADDGVPDRREEEQRAASAIASSRTAAYCAPNQALPIAGRVDLSICLPISVTSHAAPSAAQLDDAAHHGVARGADGIARDRRRRASDDACRPRRRSVTPMSAWQRSSAWLVLVRRADELADVGDERLSRSRGGAAHRRRAAPRARARIVLRRIAELRKRRSLGGQRRARPVGAGPAELRTSVTFQRDSTQASDTVVVDQPAVGA